MCKDTTKSRIPQEKSLFPLDTPISGKKVVVDFDAPDISSNGGLMLMNASKESIVGKIASVIPDCRNQKMIVHTYLEMVGQRVGQIMCGYEDANDCDRLRDDSMLKMSVGRKPSDAALASQPTMTRLENVVDSKTLFRIGKVFVDDYVASFDCPPKKVILDADDTNANTYGAQQLSLFNAYYNEYCYMPLVIFDGKNGKLILPMLRPGRRSKSVETFRVMYMLIEYLHSIWPRTIFELRGDSHFCSSQFMDWAHKKWYVRYITGLAGNSVLLSMVDKPRRRAENDYKKKAAEQKRSNEEKKAAGRFDFDTERIVIKRYYAIRYKAKSWKYAQRIIVKIEVSSEGTNIRFVVTSNQNNTPKTVYHRYCGRGQMELWIKDMKYLSADRMSCNSFKANQFRLFLHAAAYVAAHRIKNTHFKGTAVEIFTMDNFVKRIMLSAVHIVEMKTRIKVSFSQHHRHRCEMELALKQLAV